jgi:hypothetical protein
MKAYKHKLTGKVSMMPDHIGGLFDYLEPADASEIICADCAIKPEETNTEETEGN